MEVFLVNVVDEMEYNIIKSLLEVEGIVTLRKIPSTGQYMNVLFGSSYTGIDIFVMQDDYDKAKEILEAQIISDSETEVLPHQESEIPESSDRKPFQKVGCWMVMLVILATIIGLVYMLVNSNILKN